jgi:phosphoglycolate phosphatase-like HAD superfamily hydrolase
LQTVSSSFLLGTQIELLRDDISRGRIRSVLFDFDGTLSVIREGWQDVMVPFMVEELMGTPEHEEEAEIAAVVREYVDRLTGRQTIYQMIQLAEELRKRGGEPREPLAYKQIYHDRLWARIEHRIAGLKAGRIPREQMLMEGSIDLMENLRRRGLELYLASGTDIEYVLDEAEALGLTPYFPGRIYGALARYQDFSKAKIIQQILTTHDLHGSELLALGDGYVEIQNCKEVGGIAVGVASDEAKRMGMNAWKRDRLIGAGADVIITDFREQEALLAYLCD